MQYWQKDFPCSILQRSETEKSIPVSRATASIITSAVKTESFPKVHGETLRYHIIKYIVPNAKLDQRKGRIHPYINCCLPVSLTDVGNVRLGMKIRDPKPGCFSNGKLSFRLLSR